MKHAGPRRHSKPLSGLLVLCTIALAVAGELLRAELAGVICLGLSVVAAVAAWVALGMPCRRCDIDRNRPPAE